MSSDNVSSEALGQDLQAELSDLMAELVGGDGAPVQVYALEGRKWEWIFEFEAADYTTGELMERLREEGGGEFKLVARGEGGRYLINKTVAVRKVRRAAVPVSQAPDVSAMMLQAQADFRMEMMRFQAEAAKSQQEMLMRMLEVNKPAQSNLQDLLAVAELLTKNNKTDPVQTLLQGISLANELRADAPEAKETSGIGELVKTLGVPLAALVARGQAGAAAAAAAPDAQVVGDFNNDGSSVPVDGGGVEVGAMQEMMVRRALGIFVKAAERGADVVEYANIFADSYADSVPDDVILDEDKFWGALGALPEVMVHKEWFGRMRDEVIKILFEESPEESPEE